MLRRLQRHAAALVPLVLLTPVLAACGSADKHPAASRSKAAVSFTGDVGKAVKASWHGTVSKPSSAKVTTLVKGSGPKIASGDSVSAFLWVGNGTAKKAAYSDYDNGKAENIPYTAQLSALFKKVLEDETYGSRVMAVAPASDLFGTSGNSQLGIGANDTVVLVADLVKKTPVSPTPSDSLVHDAAPSSQPKVVLSKGKPTGLDWKGVAKPSLTTPVQRVVLKKGTGAVVKATDTLTVNYLGETYGAAKAFDESYTKQPLTSSLSGLVKGWAIGLTGVKVGSRVLIQIPPAYGYGTQGSGAIPANATLWFVIDVVKATKG